MICTGLSLRSALSTKFACHRLLTAAPDAFLSGTALPACPSQRPDSQQQQQRERRGTHSRRWRFSPGRNCPREGGGGGGTFLNWVHRRTDSSGAIWDRRGIVGPIGVRRAFGGGESGSRTATMVGTSPSGQSPEYLSGGRYCVLLTGYASDYSEKIHGGYGKMFITMLGDPGDTWDVYPVVDGEFPAEEELEKYDGFVVTGSRHDAHGSEDWIARLCDLLQSLHERRQRTLGVCFGHQVLSRALGGTTGKADVGWDVGLRRVQTTEALATKGYAAAVAPTFRILKVHQDQVRTIPPGAELLGFSEKTGVEIFAVGDHALGIQGHPEFTVDVVTDLIDTRLADRLKAEEQDAARASMRAGQADMDSLLRLCKGFLKRPRT